MLVLPGQSVIEQPNHARKGAVVNGRYEDATAPRLWLVVPGPSDSDLPPLVTEVGQLQLSSSSPSAEPPGDGQPSQNTHSANQKGKIQSKVNWW